jgi:hypothetical protein
MGEVWAKLHIPCVTPSTAGLYECRGVVAGVKTVVVETRVEVLWLPHKECTYKDSQDVLPTITGWFSNIMVQAGETARLVCDLEVLCILHSYSFSIFPTQKRQIYL